MTARPAFVLTRKSEGPWAEGRVGMLYRDLIPDRQGGRFIASHIRIPEGGPVPDYVHYHRVRFQMIYCLTGTVRVVYEDQGPPFELVAGDAVLQPPEIRHRVLECSPGLEVIEVSSPAEYETYADPERELPTPATRPDREFGGQRYTRHQASFARHVAWRTAGFETRDLGIAAATGGLATAEVVRRSPSGAREGAALEIGDAELDFGFVLAGSATLEADADGVHLISAGDAFVLPAGRAHALREVSGDFEWLSVRVFPS